ncbi:MAG: hypothetical protein JW984_06375 [Deltaproteobacteria bacterium]|uniref:Uncharacterized protein n=1 Tax=Candidatus Zymogenus saltonus TaxID=2844893 RepID=A0A9D8PP45_9DELT|nr:hypothetical protein [Candidatus Zymogenus saltonus]
MAISLQESQAINEMVGTLCSFLPGTPHPYASFDISFEGIAQKLGLSKYWMGGSKSPAINRLLQATLETRRDIFCRLILEIVQVGMTYRSNKGDPITREEIVQLNDQIERLSFKIPELWNSNFLDSLPRSEEQEESAVEEINQEVLLKLKNDLLRITELEAQPRGYAFEEFLNELFKAYNLDPQSSFRLVGEQIDGSFKLVMTLILLKRSGKTSKSGKVNY